MKPGSRIIFISTGVCRNSAVTPNYLLYAATKGAIDQMTRLMAKGLASKGINVNAVAPGPVATELFFEGKPESVINGIKSMNPYGKLGETGDIAKVVGFLAGEESAWVDGQIISANGGTFV
jgi:3-oxoacyl-[acyl-carrier protein] reductase